jgi:hypothetical protein
MPNNTINPYNLQPYQIYQQQGFGWVTTMINALFTNVNYPVTSSIGSFLYYGTNTPTTSAIDVSDYNNCVFQMSISASGTNTNYFYVSSSIDGLNWVGEFTASGTTASSSIFRPTVIGRRRYFMATYSGSGNTTGSLYLLAGQ